LNFNLELRIRHTQGQVKLACQIFGHRYLRSKVIVRTHTRTDQMLYIPRVLKTLKQKPLNREDPVRVLVRDGQRKAVFGKDWWNGWILTHFCPEFQNWLSD